MAGARVSELGGLEGHNLAGEGASQLEGEAPEAAFSECIFFKKYIYPDAIPISAIRGVEGRAQTLPDFA